MSVMIIWRRIAWYTISYDLMKRYRKELCYVFTCPYIRSHGSQTGPITVYDGLPPVPEGRFGGRLGDGHLLVSRASVSP
jgi:hypothetical protein